MVKCHKDLTLHSNMLLTSLIKRKLIFCAVRNLLKHLYKLKVKRKRGSFVKHTCQATSSCFNLSFGNCHLLKDKDFC
jgi:hypothetical protein